MTNVYNFSYIFLLSFSVSAALVIFRGHYMARLPSRDDTSAKQALHKEFTPRFGGVGIILAIILALMILPNRLTSLFFIFVLSLIPVVSAGLAEDLGFRVSPRGRLLAAACSSLIIIFSMGAWIPATSGIAAIDAIFAIAVLAIPLTVLWTTGIAHGFNLIDGVNGLSAGIAVIIAIGLWYVAYASGHSDLALVSLALVPALLGFLLLNWPYGKIFLGDAGAYGIGHTLVWLAIILAWLTPTISALAMALMFFWPFADTMLAIWRRHRLALPMDVPDRLHFHQLIYRSLMQTSMRKFPRRLLNSLTGLILLPIAGMPVVFAVVLRESPYLALLAWVVFGLLFVMSYRVLVILFRSRKLTASNRGDISARLLTENA